MAGLAEPTVCDLPRSTLRESLLGGVGEERGAVLGALVDAAEQPRGQGYVHPHGAVCGLRQDDEKGHGIGVRGVSHDRVVGVRGGQLLTALEYTADMKLERFLRHAARLIEGCPGAYAPREIGEVHPEIAVRVLPDQSDIAGHLMLPISSAGGEYRLGAPMLLTVPVGRSFRGLARSPDPCGKGA